MERVKRLWVVLFLLMLGILGPVKEVQAEEQTEEVQLYLDHWMKELDLSGIEDGMDQLFPGFDLDGGMLLELIMKGKVSEACNVVLQQIKGSLGGEIASVRQIFVYILVLGVISAFFSGFSDLFAGQQIAGAGFYFLYLLLMGLLTKVFLYVSQIAVSAVMDILLFIKLFIPTWFVAVGAAQGSATAVYYYQLMLMLAYLVESVLNAVLIPFIYSYIMLSLLNGLWAEEKLTLLLDFIKKGVALALKLSMGVVTGLSLVQSVIVPVVDKMKVSALRRAVSAIPGIGGLAEGVTDLVLGSAVLLKNSMGVLLMVLLFGALLVPLLKILLVTGAVKLGAAVAGIVSDKRISGCADRVGDGCFLLFRCVFTSAALFIIVIAVVACTASAWEG